MSVLRRFVIISRISMPGDRAMAVLRNEKNQECTYGVDAGLASSTRSLVGRGSEPLPVAGKRVPEVPAPASPFCCHLGPLSYSACAIVSLL
jgi:hypothetical protein